MELEREKFEGSQPRVYRLFEAIVYMLISHSELLCYFLMILDQMVYGSILSLPLPFMVFLWGMLSVPRPSKTFWITIITYTEVGVYVGSTCMQLGFFHLFYIATCFQPVSTKELVLTLTNIFKIIDSLISPHYKHIGSGLVNTKFNFATYVD